MKKEYTKEWLKKDCLICGEPCTRRLCLKCFRKNKRKGRVSRSKQFKNKNAT